MRIHPAASRVRKLSREHPVLYIIFDLLVDERGKSLVERTGKRAHTVTRTLEKLLAKPGFTDRAPGGLSRWNTARSGEWQMHGLRTAR